MRLRLVVLAILVGVTGAVASAQTAQTDPKNYSIDPWHLNVPKPIANPATSIVEKIPGSDVVAEIIYVEMNDGTYSPIAMMKPAGNGRFPLVVLAHQGPAVDTACSIDEHSQLVEALAAGDAARAVATMRAHLDALLARLDLRGTARRETNLADLLGIRRA